LTTFIDQRRFKLCVHIRRFFTLQRQTVFNLALGLHHFFAHVFRLTYEKTDLQQSIYPYNLRPLWLTFLNWFRGLRAIRKGMVCIRKNSSRAAEYFQAGIDAILASDFLDPKAKPYVPLRTALALVRSTDPPVLEGKH
jgi:hypothetical protein